MDFIRARSDDHKNIRIKQITDAASKLYETLPYDKITLASIAKDLDFSRSNLYKYVSSKEEIFLLMIKEDMNSFVKDVLATFEEVKKVPVDQFAHTWSQALFRHERLLKLFSILFTIIEANVSAASLADFKISLFTEINRMAPMLKRCIPQITDQQILLFLNIQLHYAAGLYPSTVTNEIQEEAIRLTGIDCEVEDFVTSFSRFLTIVLRGMISPAPIR